MSFLEWYHKIANNYGFRLEIYHSSIMDWCIDIGYKTTSSRKDEKVLSIQSHDMSLMFAQAEVELKEYMLKTYEGY